MSNARMANWDLLRSISMFLVVVVHTAGFLGPVHGTSIQGVIGELALICDPIFFTLSGYFAIRPLKQSYAYYLSNKVRTIVLPLFTYVVLVYFYGTLAGGITLGPSAFLEWTASILASSYWFIPTLIPYLIIAPLLYQMFSSLGKKEVRTLGYILTAACAFGIAVTLIASFLPNSRLSRIVNVMNYIVPSGSQVILGSFFPYFCLGYFVKIIPEYLEPNKIKVIEYAGIICWITGAFLSHFGYQRSDPSYLWFPATAAIFLLFSKLSIESASICKALSWTARRSYSIYLLQVTTIGIVFTPLVNNGFLGQETTLATIMRLPLFLIALLSAYLLALLIASIVDSSILRLMQAGYTKLVKKLCRAKC